MKEGQKKSRREWLSALIWLISALALYAVSGFILKDWIRYLFVLPLALIFYLLRPAILLPLSRKKRRWQNRFVRWMIYLLLCAALLTALILGRDSYGLPLYPYLTVNTPSFDPQNIASIEHGADGRFIIHTKNDTLKILQLTDLHIGGTLSTYKQDWAAFESIYFQVIQEARPDLIIITGDLVYPIPLQSLSTDNRTPLIYLCDFMEKIGIPWAFVYGNHETELLAEFNSDELSEALTAYTFDYGGHLLFSRIQPDIYGRYNNLIEVRNADGSLSETPFLLDSNDYASPINAAAPW